VGQVLAKDHLLPLLLALSPMATIPHQPLVESASTTAVVLVAATGTATNDHGDGDHNLDEGGVVGGTGDKYVAVMGTPVLAAESEISGSVRVTPVHRVPAPGVDGGRNMHRPWYGVRRWLHKPAPGTWAYTWLLAYQSIGIIYGDIGTSPLYAFTALFPGGPPDPDNVLGGLSCMIWTLVVVVVVKYVMLVLLADDHGEGGTFAMYSMLSRILRDKVADPLAFRRYNRILAIMAIVGVTAVMSDGVLTPAISVLSAVGGITVAAPDLSAAGVTGIAAAILFVLMLVQRFGTARVAFTFSPIVLLWYISIVGIGIYYIAQVHNAPLWVQYCALSCAD
jgi:hypothetical protein